ncbi:MAG: hypothetical protein HOG03_07385 [Desulfobacula sp.]|uniref:MBL fold metallo-hydrolase n=1 Tax=Desulfobacula sp. TaxID=2593537 RepID=UPI001DC9E551|nr:hypothetical protein [Desulfobacula sp.]MBT3484780.1 hypothetical protein [Desulfobacula sp.]MBT3804409.1 hypothetical protein [Desulfobacula sp.]MBT4025200.1 hypothetical protein [Desulfobacula sp.]MBT4198603.1 hypothetical protein [Desulfobacula sp.]
MGNSDKIMWLGHSSFLLRLSNKIILLDPFLSDYATSYPPFGPKRYAPPGLPVTELPQIDLIIISHNHYDYALVPIGDYRPAPKKNHAHVTPEEAVQMGLNLQSKNLIPTHWGSIILSQAPPFEAPDRFLKAGLKAGFNEANLWIMKIGETRGISVHL